MFKLNRGYIWPYNLICKINFTILAICIGVIGRVERFTTKFYGSHRRLKEIFHT